MPMRMEEARDFMMQALRLPFWTQVEELTAEVGKIKAKAHPQVQQVGRFSSDGRGNLEQGESSLLNEIIWTLIIQGILVPGRDDNNKTLPFIRLTEYGKRCVAENKILPHDPDGYLKEFQVAVPAADPAVVEYVTEALQCFIHGLNRSAAIMLGGASEKAILQLIDSCVASIGDPNRQAAVAAQVAKAPSIYKRYAVFEKQFLSFKGSLPRELAENVDSLLRGVFDLIRNSRNDSGHPASGVMVDRDTNYSHLKLFVPYCKRIYGLIDWLQHNQT